MFNVRFIVLLVVVASLCGCARTQRETNDPRYFGGFKLGAVYRTQTETILTADKSFRYYSTPISDRVGLVPVNSKAATNYISGKFTRTKIAPVKEQGRLPAGSRVKFIGIDKSWDPVEWPAIRMESTCPVVQILEGPLQGLEVGVADLCDAGWDANTLSFRMENTILSVDGKEIVVFKPLPVYLKEEP